MVHCEYKSDKSSDKSSDKRWCAAGLRASGLSCQEILAAYVRTHTAVSTKTGPKYKIP